MPTKEQNAPAESDPAPTPEEAEAAAAAGEDKGGTEEEVRPEELTAGIGRPVGASAWPEDIVDELRKPLDPNRVRRRSGRGSGQFEYLAGHDVKRRANEIFGFGNWGHTIVEQVEIGAVEVKRDNGGEGWHVAYRCIVRVWVRHEGGLYETQGSGYGDGVEYTPAARLTACELALKESETDALKRAFTDLGDQFGLILYAKDDEKKRIDRDSSRDSTRAAVRRDHEPNVPKNWTEVIQRFDATVGQEGNAEAWLEELVEKHAGQPSLRDLAPRKRQEVFQLFASAVLALEAEGDLAFVTNQRELIRAALASRFGGISLDGPPWRLGPGEEDRPMKGEAPAEAAAAAAPGA